MGTMPQDEGQLGVGREAEAGAEAGADLYHRLEEATPEERSAIVLQLVRERPEGRLELPTRDGVRANLQGVDLSRARLEAEQPQPQARPPGPPRRRNQCAALEGANLQGAVLINANFEEACLWGANLAKAELTEANLQRADLWRATLRGAALGGANLRQAVLNNADLRDGFLWEADFENAALQGADLRGAEFEDTNLRGADLRRARLEEAALSTCDLAHIYVSGAWLQRTRLQQEQLGVAPAAIGEELAGDYAAAKQGYLALKHNFDSLGDYTAASWAHGKERRMEKLHALEQGGKALAERKWRAAAADYARFSALQSVEWLCDYGESISRVLLSLILLVVVFALIYGVAGGVVRLRDAGSSLAPATTAPTRNPVELLLFSLGTITRMTPLDLEPRSDLFGLIAGVEALLGVAFTGLLGFVVGYRIRRG